MKKILYIGNQSVTENVNLSSIDTLSKLLQSEGFDVVTASNKNNKALRMADMLRHVFLHSKNTDFVLIDTYSTINFWYAFSVAVACRWLQLKYIPILHGGNLPDRLKKSPAASDFIFNNAEINIAPSNYLMEVFKNLGFTNLEYIPNSIDLKNYNFLIRENIRPKLLWVRAFAEIYNPMLALKVLEEMLLIYPDAELCMVGPAKDGSFLKCKKYAEEKGLPVHFMGKLEKEDWISLSEEYDIFLNTTNFDNTPVSVIEAMSLGIPVISTNVGGIPYLLTDGKEALLVPPKKASKILNKIEYLMNNPQKSVEMTRNARKKIETFDWKVVREDWMRIIG